jgi:hypothetical protein
MNKAQQAWLEANKEKFEVVTNFYADAMENAEKRAMRYLRKYVARVLDVHKDEDGITAPAPASTATIEFIRQNSLEAGEILQVIVQQAATDASSIFKIANGVVGTSCKLLATALDIILGATGVGSAVAMYSLSCGGGVGSLAVFLREWRLTSADRSRSKHLSAVVTASKDEFDTPTP